MTPKSTKILAAIFCLLLALECLGISFPPVHFTAYLVFGWIGYLWRVLPQARIDWPTVAAAVACLAGILALGHTFARWLWRESAPAPADAVRPPWRLRWTLTAVMVIALMFTAGIAATGVTHQSVWLAKMEGPMFVWRGRTREEANRIRCASNLRQIGHCLLLHARDHGGRLPDHLEEIMETWDVAGFTFICPSADDREHMSDSPTTREVAARLREGQATYVYHGRGLRLPLPATRPIACEPLGNHQAAGMNILFADGSVEFHTPAEAAQILTQLPPTTSPPTSAPASTSPAPGARP